MLKIAAFLSALCLVASARADEPTVPVPAQLLPAVVSPPAAAALRADVEQRAEDGRRLRNAGIATTVVGTVLTGVGVGLFMSGLCLDSCHDGDGVAFSAGIAMLTLGQGGVLAGIPMWAVGGARASRAERVQLAISASALQGRF